MILPITKQEINQNKVASLPARPNASVAFGGAGYTSDQLKAAFDRLPLLLVERYNALLEAIQAEGDGSLLAQIPTGIPNPEGGTYTLGELLCHIKEGKFATYLKVGESYLDLALDALAPLESPALCGSPTAPTPDASDASGRIATTAFVQAAIEALKGTVVPPQANHPSVGGESITVDQVFNPESRNPQSGIALSEIITYLEDLASHYFDSAKAYTNTKINTINAKVVQKPGESETLVMSQKAVTELVADALGNDTPTYETVDSVEEMTDTTKQYVLDGTVWAYTTKEVYVEHNAYDANYVNGFNRRVNGSGVEVSLGGALLTDYVAQTYDEECLVTIKGAEEGTEGIKKLEKNYDTYLVVDYYDADKTWLTQVVAKQIWGTQMDQPDLWKDDGVLPIVLKPFLVTDSNKQEIIKNAAFIRIKLGIKTNPTTITAADCQGLVINFSTKEGKYQEISEWVDTGLSPSQGGGNYVDLLMKINDNTDQISELDHRVAAVESGSDTLTIPSYWEETVAEKVQTVKALQEVGGKDCVCFAWAADTHIPDNYSGWTNALGRLMAKMMDDCEIPFAVLSGDIGTQSSQSTEAKLIETQKYIPQHLAPLWGTDRLIMALGNHDGCWGEGSDTNVSGYYSQRFSQEKLWQLYFRGQALDFRRVFSDNGLYFYVDNKAQKTRFIVLNSHFAADLNGKNVFATSCYGQAQLNWLSDVALDMPEGYGAVITAHVPPKIVHDESTEYTVDHAQLKGIINAYNNKTTFSGSYTAGTDGWSNSTVSVDFTDAKGEVIALFAGHIHEDTVDTETMACPLMTITTAGSKVYNGSLSRAQGTATETSFDIVTVNRATRTIYCTRVGAGDDREISY